MVAEATSSADTESGVEEFLQTRGLRGLVRRRRRVWTFLHDGTEIWARYLPDAGPRNRDVEDPPEPALEFVRPLSSRDAELPVLASHATELLRLMATKDHIRLTDLHHPDATGKSAIAAVATLYLADLDPRELSTVLDELTSLALPRVK